MVETTCSNCGNKKSFNEDKLGKKYKCPNCGNIVSIEKKTNEQIINKTFIDRNSGSPSLSESHDNDNSTKKDDVPKLKPSIGTRKLTKKSKLALIFVSILIFCGIVFWILFGTGGAIIFSQNTHSGNTFDSSNNTNNIQPASIANSNNNIQAQSGALNYIRKFEGKDPINSKLFETSPLKERLIQLLGDKYKIFIDNMGTPTPIKIINDTLFTSGCLPDKCGSDEAAISILFNSDKILVGIINDDKHTFYSEKPFPDQLPQELKLWFDYRINAIQNKLEKLHKYNFTGTVVSVEEQGNRGMTYLSIKTVDGKDESFLINGAKLYKDNQEVNFNLLIKGINVGVIGGDEAKRIDILDNTSTTDSKVQGKYPQASERLISQSEFNGMSKADMKIMRNEIFARHGYIFKTEDMSSYFSKQSWYKGQYEDVTSMLSNIEKQNVELIKRFEN